MFAARCYRNIFSLCRNIVFQFVNGDEGKIVLSQVDLICKIEEAQGSKIRMLVHHNRPYLVEFLIKYTMDIINAFWIFFFY